MTNRTEKLTKPTVTNAPLATDPPQYIIWDTETKGFGLRVSRQTKSFIFKGRVHGKVRKVTIGSASDLTVSKARDKANAYAVEMRAGTDPKARKARDSATEITLRDSLDDYLDSNRRLKDRTRDEYRAVIKRKLSDWLDKPLATITPQMVKRRYQKLTEEAPTQGDYAFRVFRIACNNAIGLMEDAGATPITNPCRVLGRQKMWRGVVRKQSVIPPDRLPDWWRTASELAEGDRAVADFFRFLLLTGLRKSEALNLKWRDVDMKRRTMTIHETKNKRVLTLPIADHVLELLTERHLDRGQREYVFESSRGRVSNVRYFQEDMNRLTGLWITPHDLRRTFLSIGADILPELVLKRLVNHVNSANVTEGYVIKSVDDLRDAMQRLETRTLQLARVIDPKAKVIDLAQHRSA